MNDLVARDSRPAVFADSWLPRRGARASPLRGGTLPLQAGLESVATAREYVLILKGFIMPGICQRLVGVLIFSQWLVSTPLALAAAVEDDVAVVKAAVRAAPGLEPIFGYMNVWQSFATSEYCEKSFGLGWIAPLELDGLYREQAGARQAVMVRGQQLIGAQHGGAVKLLACMGDRQCAFQRAQRHSVTIAQCMKIRDESYAARQLLFAVTGGGSSERMMLKDAYDKVFAGEPATTELDKILANSEFASEGIRDNIFTKGGRIAFAKDGHDFFSILRKYVASRGKGGAYDAKKDEFESQAEYTARVFSDQPLYGNVTTSSLLAFPIGPWKKVSYDPEKARYTVRAPLVGWLDPSAPREPQLLGRIDYFKGQMGAPNVQIMGGYPACWLDGKSTPTYPDVPGEVARKVETNSRLYVVGFLQSPFADFRHMDDPASRHPTLRIFPIALVVQFPDVGGEMWVKSFLCHSQASLQASSQLQLLPAKVQTLLRDPASSYLYVNDFTSRVGIAFQEVPERDGVPGIVMNSIIANSPAARAGLAAKDRLLRINDIEARHLESVLAFIRTRPAGTTLRLQVMRGEAQKEFLVTTDPVEVAPAPAVPPKKDPAAVFSE